MTDYPVWAKASIAAYKRKEIESLTEQQKAENEENEKQRRLLAVALSSAGISTLELDITTNPTYLDGFSFGVELDTIDYMLKIEYPEYYKDSSYIRDKLTIYLPLCRSGKAEQVILLGTIQEEEFMITVGAVLLEMLEKIEVGKIKEATAAKINLVDLNKEPSNVIQPSTWGQH